MFLEVFNVILLIAATFDVYFAYYSFKSQSEAGKYLGYVALASSFVAITYFFSITLSHYLFMSIASSLYFIGVDAVLLSLIAFVSRLTSWEVTKLDRNVYKTLCIYAVFEVFVFFINPFKEIAISYSHHPVFPFYTYNMLTLYALHLVFTYSMVVLVIYMLVRRILQMPREYRITSEIVLSALLTIVAINAMFLFLPDLGVVSLLDYSIIGYSIGVYIMYWSYFDYRKNGLLDRFRLKILSNIEQGILLFDLDGNLIIHTKRADDLISSYEINDQTLMSDFVDKLNISNEDINIQKWSRQITLSDGKTLRLDFRKIYNDNETFIGSMFTFTDVTNEMDLLTGFHNFSDFIAMEKRTSDFVSVNLSVTIFDPNRISVTNAAYGYQAGDLLIRELADLIRRHFPSGSYFVRGQDANLIVFTYGLDEIAIEECIGHIIEDYSGSFQYTYKVNASITQSLADLANEVIEGLKIKKLLDTQSSHSQTLTSLVKALQQSDNETEAHVKRTQYLGRKLGKQLGLTEIEMNNLALLCLLHDIGKIGIPLEILNKPGKLTEDEWNTLKTHADKGYQIAMSSKDLMGIANMIRYHHERWDGKGYPDGLSKESIPLLSRVIAVVDAFDAMISNRPYRQGMTIEEAKTELLKAAGTQFDPHIVAEFIRVLQNDREFVDGSYMAEENNISDYLVQDYRESFGYTSQDVKQVNVYPVLSSKYYMDSAGLISKVDDAFETITGYTKEEAEGKLNHFDFIPEEDKMEYMVQLNNLLSTSTEAYVEHNFVTKSNEVIKVLCYGVNYYDSSIKQSRTQIIVTPTHTINYAKIISEEARKKEEIHLKQWIEIYRTDSLTKVLTRNAFINDVEEKLIKSDKILFAMFDIDNFKAYNDEHGHLKGDDLLVEVSSIASKCVLNKGVVGRLGGDEFALAIFYKANKDLQDQPELLFKTMSSELSKYSKNVSISMGIVLGDCKDYSFNSLYEFADNALYKSKDKGKSTYTIFKN